MNKPALESMFLLKTSEEHISERRLVCRCHAVSTGTAVGGVDAVHRARGEAAKEGIELWPHVAEVLRQGH